jgi:hypothetical protein
MATISRTGITDGGTIQPAHITNIIDALDGTSTTTTVVATGSFTGSLIGTLTGNATTATTATNATNVAVTNTTTGTGPYYVTFVEAATGNVGQRVDATGLTYNATTNTITATSSYAAAALSASYAANVPATASYALTALSSSYALTASYALNAGGGTGTGFPFTGSAQVTGSMGITGSLQVTGGVTASLFGTASFATRTRDEFITLNFTHHEITNTTTGTTRYFGGFGLPTNSTVGRIGLAAPFNCTIVSSSITIYNSSFSGGGQVDYSLYITGSLASTLSNTIDLDDYIKDEAKAIGVLATSGDLLTIELRELADSTGTYQTHVALLLKKL